MPANQQDSPPSALLLGALGVVFGDIGTSPIYALRACLSAAGSPSQDNVLGIVSMILWAILIVVTLKYVCFVLRADNDGEGGIVALTGLVQNIEHGRVRKIAVTFGLLGAGMFYGDSMVTPAVSVLSAVEGLREVSNRFTPFVVPGAALILVGLFALQHRGSDKVGKLFGPVMVVWFLSLAAMGVYQIAETPAILEAVSPLFAARFVARDPGIAFVVLGSVILALTGAEALYADIGHFGRPAIRRAWFFIVLPCIVMGYFGEGALVLAHADAAKDPYFHAWPSWALIPAVLVATLATVIASQAVITGAFSMTSQALELNLLPRMKVVETSTKNKRQVYVPLVNGVLFVAVMFLVLFFRSSDRLTSAYGIAVASTMFVTTMLMAAVTRHLWRWSVMKCVSVVVPLIFIDIVFVAANARKVLDGGWFPVSIGLILLVLMLTWQRGRNVEIERLKGRDRDLKTAIDCVFSSEHPPQRVRGTAVYPGIVPGVVPAAFRMNLKHYDTLHETCLFFENVSHSAPMVEDGQRIEINELGHGCVEVTAHHGFMERPDIAAIVASLEPRIHGWNFDAEHVTYFLPRSEIEPEAGAPMPVWQRILFKLMARSMSDAAQYYRLPPERVVEVGAQFHV